MIKLLRGAGLAGWVRGHWIAGFELDFAFPERRIAIEVDGWAWHWDVERFRGDRRRQNAIELAGWTVLRFTWDDLTNRPTEVVAQIHDAIGRTEHLTRTHTAIPLADVHHSRPSGNPGGGQR